MSPEKTVSTYQVLLCRRAGVQAAFEALAKRAARKGLTPHAWTWGKAYTKRKHTADSPCNRPGTCDGCENVSRIPLDIEGDSPHYEGWSFAACLQHLDGENIVRTVPGETLSSMYRSRGPACDHCQFNRRRNDTYVLRHTDGRTVQVGSTCIGDFLGSHDATKIAAAASYLAEACSLAEDGCEGGGTSSFDRSLDEYLPFVAWCVRVNGWTSRTVAREHDKLATADEAWTYLIDRKKREQAACEPTDDDRATAASAEAWGESMTDDEVNTGSGDYLHNLRAVACTGLVTNRTAGIGASMVTAWQRAMGQARRNAERADRASTSVYVGEAGKCQSFGVVVLDFVTGYETDYGYTTVCKFRTADGALLVWKASSTEIARDDVGKHYTLTGTVKKHEEYKGEKQTILSRCKAVEAAQVAA